MQIHSPLIPHIRTRISSSALPFSISSDLVQAIWFNRGSAGLPGCAPLVATTCRRLDIISIVRRLLLGLATGRGEGVLVLVGWNNCDGFGSY